MCTCLDGNSAMNACQSFDKPIELESADSFGNAKLVCPNSFRGSKTADKCGEGLTAERC